MKAIMELPVGKIGFGGIVGSRVEITSDREILVQVAYLEKGESARVRYTEKLFAMNIDQPTQTLELKLAEVEVLDGDLNKTKLRLEIACTGETEKNKER